MAEFGTNASGILFSYRLYTLGPLCLWQCFISLDVDFLHKTILFCHKIPYTFMIYVYILVAKFIRCHLLTFSATFWATQVDSVYSECMPFISNRGGEECLAVCLGDVQCRYIEILKPGLSPKSIICVQFVQFVAGCTCPHAITRILDGI